VINSILKGPKFILPFSLTISKCLVISIFFSLNFSITKLAVNGVAYILHLSSGQT